MGKRGPKPKVKTEDAVKTSSPEAVNQEAAPEVLISPRVPVFDANGHGVVVVDPPVMTGGVDGETSSPTPPPPPAPVKAPEPPAVNTSGYPDDVWETRKVLKLPLDPNQEFFESPEGYIVIGEKGRGRVWCRQANNRKGCWINPMR